MKTLLKLFIILIAGTPSSNSYAFPELPFCPAGGPPGWLNYFNDKRDQNKWRRYSQYNSSAYNVRRHPGYYGPAYSPAFRQYSPMSPPVGHTPNYQPK